MGKLKYKRKIWEAFGQEINENVLDNQIHRWRLINKVCVGRISSHNTEEK